MAGTTLYVQTRWQALAELPVIPEPLAFSLRLYDEQGQLIAQHDDRSLPSTVAWVPNELYSVPLAVSVPVATKPGIYGLELVVYDPANGQPLLASRPSGDQAPIRLGEVNVAVSQRAPLGLPVLATFDYLDLVSAESHLADQSLVVKLVWRPQPRSYTDTYLASLELHDPQGKMVQQWQEPLGGWRYPSSQWPATIPVRDQYHLPLNPGLPAGEYTLSLRLLRNRDQTSIPAHQGRWPSPQSTLPLETIHIEQPQ